MQAIMTDTTVLPYIQWSPCGKNVCVLQLQGLCDVVLQKYFGHGNWLTFCRQLCIYGFRKLKAPEAVAVFHHSLFTEELVKVCAIFC